MEFGMCTFAVWLMTPCKCNRSFHFCMQRSQNTSEVRIEHYILRHNLQVV